MVESYERRLNEGFGAVLREASEFFWTWLSSLIRPFVRNTLSFGRHLGWRMVDDLSRD